MGVRDADTGLKFEGEFEMSGDSWVRVVGQDLPRGIKQEGPSQAVVGPKVSRCQVVLRLRTIDKEKDPP